MATLSGPSRLRRMALRAHPVQLRIQTICGHCKAHKSTQQECSAFRFTCSKERGSVQPAEELLKRTWSSCISLIYAENKHWRIEFWSVSFHLLFKICNTLKSVVHLCWDTAFAVASAAMYSCAVFHRHCVQESRQSSVTLHTTSRQWLPLQKLLKGPVEELAWDSLPL